MGSSQCYWAVEVSDSRTSPLSNDPLRLSGIILSPLASSLETIYNLPSNTPFTLILEHLKPCSFCLTANC